MKTKRMRATLMLALAAAVAAAMSVPLYAQSKTSDAGRPDPAFQKPDTNRDGTFGDDEFLNAQVLNDGTRVKGFIDDSVITARVKAAFVKDKEVSALDVSVETDKGIVLLSGFVESELQVRRAYEIAASISGVKDVKSNLVVKG